jgi:glyoxylase-like metal-dependent hydrolase (beta-lactamase superfamily II)
VSKQALVCVIQLNHGTRLSLKSSATLIIDQDEAILVDPGHFKSLEEIDASLKSTPVQGLADITTVFYTHLHFDHYKAFDFGSHVRRICIPEAELTYTKSLMQFWNDKVRYTQFLMDTHERIAPVFMRQFVYMAADKRYNFEDQNIQRRLQLVRTEEWLTPHVQAVALDGHCPGQLGLEIVTGDGAIIVAGDALLSLEDFLASNTDHHLIVHNQQRLLASRQRCAQADCAIPGHGPWFNPKTAVVLEQTIWGCP